MSDTICFEIDGKSLLLDTGLITFTIPVFFICRDDDNQKYAVLCTDTERLHYIVGKVKITAILAMLNDTLSLRDFFLTAIEKWRILAGDDYTDDKIEKIDSPNDDELPETNTYFNFLNSKIEEYKKQLKDEQENNIYSMKMKTECFQSTKTPLPFSVKIDSNNIGLSEYIQDMEYVIIHLRTVPFPKYKKYPCYA